VLVVNGPYFPSAAVHLANGNTLTINAEGAGPNAPYVQGLAIDGAASSKSWLRFGDVSAGATLDFTMGPSASASWGKAASDLPPSFAP
jgi:putative alpha-1,2-mannosidase